MEMRNKILYRFIISFILILVLSLYLFSADTKATYLKFEKACKLFSERNYEQAINLFREVLKIDSKGYYDSYLMLGKIYYKMGYMQKAIKEYEKFVELANSEIDAKDISDAYNELGNCKKEVGLYDEAIRLIEDSLKIEDDINDEEKDIRKAVRYNNLGAVYFSLGDLEKAAKFFENSKKINEAKGNVKGLANDINNMALIYREKGIYEKSQKLIIDALDKLSSIPEDIETKEIKAACKNNMGIIYSITGNYMEAINNFKSSIQLYGEVKDLKNRSSVYLNLADVYVRQIYSFEKEKDKKSKKDKDQIKELYETAFTYYNRANLIKIKIQDLSGVAYSYWWMGYCQEYLQNYKRALKYYELAREIYMQLGSRDADLLKLFVDKVRLKVFEEDEDDLVIE